MFDKKKGQFFALYLVLVTLFMCSVVVLLYFNGNDILDNSIVSPLSVIDVLNEEGGFRVQEEGFLYASVLDSGMDEDLAKDVYCSYFSEKSFSDFVFEDIYYLNRGAEEWRGALDSVEEKKGFCESVYVFSGVGEGLRVERKELGKKKRLVAGEREKVNFPMGFEYFYSAEYLIKEDGAGYSIERVD